MPFLSVIIPVYNVEKYLEQCVDSVLNQELEDFEIILVDDGSTDNCPVICDHYASMNPYIHVIHKQNGGLSSARNAGLLFAKGEYVIYLDSDDWWNPIVNVNKLLEIVRKNQNIDMFQFFSLDYIEGKGLFVRSEHEHCIKICTTDISSYYNLLLNNGNLEVHAATKIFKRRFLIDNNLLFLDGIKSEDNEWIFRVFRCLTSVKTIDEKLYIYRAGREGSITQTIGKKHLEDLLFIVEQCIKYNKDNPENTLKEYEFDYAAYLWFSALGLSASLPQNERKNLMERFDSTSFVCAYGRSKKAKLCNIVYRMAGFQLTTAILGMYISVKEKWHLHKKSFGREIKHA